MRHSPSLLSEVRPAKGDKPKKQTGPGMIDLLWIFGRFPKSDSSERVRAFLKSPSCHFWATAVFTVATECRYGRTKGRESPLSTGGWCTESDLWLDLNLSDSSTPSVSTDALTISINGGTGSEEILKLSGPKITTQGTVSQKYEDTATYTFPSTGSYELTITLTRKAGSGGASITNIKVM